MAHGLPAPDAVDERAALRVVWPAHAVLALMDLREGRVGRARARAAAEYLPDHVSVLVEADAALVEGSAVECLDLLAPWTAT